MARQIAWLCGLMFLCSLPAVLAAAPQGSGQQSDQPPTYFVKKAPGLARRRKEFESNSRRWR